MVPEVPCEPCGCGEVPFPAVAAEDVDGRAHGPTRGFFAELLEGGLAAAGNHGDGPVEERPCAFGEVRRLGEPVVHLDVDVGMVVGEPGGLVAVVPKALQIGREETARAGRQQIAAVLEHEHFQMRIGRALAVFVEALVDWFRRRGSHIEDHAAHEPGEIGHMRSTKFIVAFHDGLFRLPSHRGRRVFAAAESLVRIERIVGGRGEHQSHRVAGEGDPVSAGSGGASFGNSGELRGMTQAIGESARDAQGVSGGNGGLLVRSHQARLAGDSRGLVRAQADDDGFVGLAGEDLAGVGDAVLFPGGGLDSGSEVKLAGKTRETIGFVSTEIDQHIAEVLIRAELVHIVSA